MYVYIYDYIYVNMRDACMHMHACIYKAVLNRRAFMTHAATVFRLPTATTSKLPHLVVDHRLLQLLLRVHHERPARRDRLVDDLAAEYQDGDVLAVGANPHVIPLEREQ